MPDSHYHPRGKIVDEPTRWVGYTFAQIAELEIGQALFVPWEQLDDYDEGDKAVRSFAWKWSQRLGRKFKTRKSKTGMYVIRRE
jgi:hypothetical protein